MRRCGRITQVGLKSNFLKGAVMLWMYVSALILAYVFTIIIRVSSQRSGAKNSCHVEKRCRSTNPPLTNVDVNVDSGGQSL